MIHNPFVEGAISSATVERLEDLTIALGVVLALAAPGVGSAPLARLERWFGGIARRRFWAVLIAGLLPVVLRVLMLPIVPVPQPAIHEEFSNLLAADTFAEGRLSNPEHPMAEYLDTFQVLQHPAYGSIRPPGYPAFLALGQVLGSSWIGVCISVGLMCAATCWMLQGWVPPGWALLGAVLLGLRIGVLGYWMNSYWGGSVTALGGALAVGALPRIKRCLPWSGAVPLGLGIVVIAVTRIYEGFFLLLPIGADLLGWLFRNRARSWRMKWRHCVAPPVIVLAGFCVWSGYYNWRTTGSVTASPYTTYRSHYSSAPAFVWQHPEPRSFAIPAMRDYFIAWEVPYFQRIVSRSTYVSEVKKKLCEFYLFYFRAALIPPLLMLPWMLRDRRMRLIWIILAAELVAASLEVWGAPYYFAGLTCIIYLILIQGLRHLRQVTWRGRPVGIFLVRWVALSVAGMFLLSVTLQAARIRIKDAGIFFFSPGVNPMHSRAELQRRLESRPRKQLALVRYAPDHNPHEEWVWNRADIDHAKVVWARDLGPESELRLTRYFADREVWLIEPDHGPPQIRPYVHLAGR